MVYTVSWYDEGAGCQFVYDARATPEAMAQLLAPAAPALSAVRVYCRETEQVVELPHGPVTVAQVEDVLRGMAETRRQRTR